MIIYRAMIIYWAIITSDLSVKDVAADLGMHPETIRRLLAAGEMPGYEAGRH